MRAEAVRGDKRSCSNTGQNALTFPGENLVTAEIKMVKYYYEESAPCFSAVTCSADDLCTCCRGKDFTQVTERKSVDERLVKMARGREKKAEIKNIPNKPCIKVN